jgi:DNA-binding Lrp family transcriptional regulator
VARHDVHLAYDLWLIALRQLEHRQAHLLLIGRCSAVERVAGFLREIEHRSGEAGWFGLPMTRRDIADYLGLTIETVSRAVTQLEQEGALLRAGARRLRLCHGVLHRILAARARMRGGRPGEGAMTGAAAEPTTDPVATGRPRRIGARLADEVRRIAAIFAYLWAVFGVLVLHESVVLSRHGLEFRFYGFALINSWILAKVMVIAESLDARPRFEGRPLMIPIGLRSAAFAVILVLAYAVEETLLGLWKGKPLAESLPAIGGGGVRGPAVIALIMAVALVPYFTWRELGRVLGRDRLRALMLTGREA